MSTIKTNTLTGTSTAGSIVVTGEGNSTTTNLQQGLAKAWVKANNAAVVADSLNVSTGVDNGTGDYQFNLSSSMANTEYCQITGAIAAELTGVKNTTIVSSNFKITSFRRTDSYTVADANTFCSIHGDLA
tara:strand:- start:11 stop:400 length:390 start_codon:yes stop_codon:yes gene_type:complete